jgi:hypothetical protein
MWYAFLQATTKRDGF